MSDIFRLLLPLRKPAIVHACAVDQKRHPALRPGWEPRLLFRGRYALSVKARWKKKTLTPWLHA